MSKHEQFIRLTHFLFAIKSGLGVKSGWRLDILFTLVLLFIVLETDFLLYVLSPAWISWYIFSTLFTTFRPIKSTLYSVFYATIFQFSCHVCFVVKDVYVLFGSIFCYCCALCNCALKYGYQTGPVTTEWWQASDLLCPTKLSQRMCPSIPQGD